MRKIGDINTIQVRIIGALLEKEQATPDYYPPTTNALLAACNQKSNRDPVMKLQQAELMDELEVLRTDVLIWRNDSGRVPKWSQSISRRLGLSAEEKAVLTVLMLRGPQTLGELRTRTERLHHFSSLEAIESALSSLAVEDRDLVIELARRPGQKENRWMHLLSGRDAVTEAESLEASRVSSSPAGPSRRSNSSHDLTQRVSNLEAEVQQLKELVQKLLNKSSP